MLRAISHSHHHHGERRGSITLDAADRHIRRKLVVTDQGEKLMVDLPEAVLLADGDAFVLENGASIAIIAAAEPLYEVREGARAPLRHLAWHLGNRHLPAQIDEHRILIRRNPVMKAMLEGLGAEVFEVIDRFQPVHGAYHGHAEAHRHE
jgi:urease accessory protein